MHPDHDCQCTLQVGHKGGWETKHHCWHEGGPGLTAWPAWLRGKRDLELVKSKRNLVASGPAMIDAKGDIHVEHAHVVQV